MSNSIPQATTCPLGKYCPRQPSDPGTAHPPPEDWLLETIKELQVQVAAQGAFNETANGESLVGFYVSPSGSPVVFVWRDKDGRMSQHTVGE